MCAACEIGRHEIRNLFNSANMRVEITSTISNVLTVYIRFTIFQVQLVKNERLHIEIVSCNFGHRENSVIKFCILKFRT